MAQKEIIAVRILELPGVAGGCACGSMPCTPEAAAMFQQKVAELRAALEESYPGRTMVEHVNLKENQAERESEIGQLLASGKYPGPLVVIDGIPRFAGAIQVQQILKEVGGLLG